MVREQPGVVFYLKVRLGSPIKLPHIKNFILFNTV